MDEEYQVNEQFLQFKDKNVIVGLRDGNEYEGKLISIDNYLNVVLEQDNKIITLKGGKVIEIILNEWIYFSTSIPKILFLPL